MTKFPVGTIHIRTWMLAGALVLTLYLIYAPSFTTDYLMADEVAHIGMKRDVSTASRFSFISLGRGLFGVYSSLVYRFVGFDPMRVQLVRFLNFASLATIAVVLFYFFLRQVHDAWLAFWIVLFLYSQPAVLVLMGYSVQIVSNSQPAMWLSLTAFYVYFYAFGEKKKWKWVKYGITLTLFLAAMQSTQTYAFFAMVPLTVLVLTEWEVRKSEIGVFFLIALFSFVISAVLYRATLTYVGHTGYKMAEQGFGALVTAPGSVAVKAVNPLGYWSAFTMWSYPFPFHYTQPLGKLKEYLALGFLFTWVVIIVSAVITEVRADPSVNKIQVTQKWLGMLVCLGFGALWMVADSPLVIIEHRPHMTLTFVGVVIFAAAYALRVLASRYSVLRGLVFRSGAVLFVIFVAVGAQSGFLRGVVDNYADQLDFIRTELADMPKSGSGRIVVVLPDEEIRLREPCGKHMGNGTMGRWHETRKGRYRYALATMGVEPDSKEIVFVTERPIDVQEDEVVVDWMKYVAARRHRASYLRER